MSGTTATRRSPGADSLATPTFIVGESLSCAMDGWLCEEARRKLAARSARSRRAYDLTRAEMDELLELARVAAHDERRADERAAPLLPRRPRARPARRRARRPRRRGRRHVRIGSGDGRVGGEDGDRHRRLERDRARPRPARSRPRARGSRSARGGSSCVEQAAGRASRERPSRRAARRHRRRRARAGVRRSRRRALRPYRHPREQRGPRARPRPRSRTARRRRPDDGRDERPRAAAHDPARAPAHGGLARATSSTSAPGPGGRPTPAAACTSARRRAVRALTEVLRKELVGRIRVTTVDPGMVGDTEFSDVRFARRHVEEGRGLPRACAT